MWERWVVGVGGGVEYIGSDRGGRGASRAVGLWLVCMDRGWSMVVSGDGEGGRSEVWWAWRRTWGVECVGADSVRREAEDGGWYLSG